MHLKMGLRADTDKQREWKGALFNRRNYCKFYIYILLDKIACRPPMFAPQGHPPKVAYLTITTTTVLMLDHRLRRWSNIMTTLGQLHVSTGLWRSVVTAICWIKAYARPVNEWITDEILLSKRKKRQLERI